jgi:hypothetical protein
MEELERAGFWTGGGGWYSSEIARMRLWNEMRREGLKVQEDIGERPELWEVALGEGKPDTVNEEMDEGKVFEAYHVSLVFRARLLYPSLYTQGSLLQPSGLCLTQICSFERLDTFILRDYHSKRSG